MSQDGKKKEVAKAAISYIEDDTIVGVGIVGGANHNPGRSFLTSG